MLVYYANLYKRTPPHFKLEIVQRWIIDHVTKESVEHHAIYGDYLFYFRFVEPEANPTDEKPFHEFAWINDNIYQCIYYTDQGKIEYVSEYYILPWVEPFQRIDKNMTEEEFELRQLFNITYNFSFYGK